MQFPFKLFQDSMEKALKLIFQHLSRWNNKVPELYKKYKSGRPTSLHLHFHNRFAINIVKFSFIRSRAAA